MTVKVRRYLKNKNSARKRKLLDELSFLKGIQFYAIAEHKKGKEKEVRIEFQTKPIRRIISKAKEHGKLNRVLIIYRNENASMRQELEELKGALEVLSSKYKLVPRQKEEKLDQKYKSPENFINILQKHGYNLVGIPLQGGAPT